MKGLVSVVMGVHNEKAEYLISAIDSICNQSYKQIELIIIDDASNDQCKKLLSAYESRFDMITVIHNLENRGLTKSLNEGLAIAKGEFIARMDADDYSVPSRIEKQVRFLEENDEIDVCGTGVVSFGETNAFMSPSNGMGNDEAQCCLFFSSTLCHPSVMMRKAFLDAHSLRYDESFSRGQDYDLWERCSVCGHLAVIDEVLVYYRIHSQQITSKYRGGQNDAADAVRMRRLSRLGVMPTETELKCHSLLNGGKDNSVSVSNMCNWIKKLIEANDKFAIADPIALRKDLNQRLVLFKLRNREFLSLINYSDLRSIIGIMANRWRMAVKLHKSNRLLNRYFNCE